MKKIILSLIGLLATAAFAPQASALPAFARQTGMACNACHQQHFPVLNSFGRAFKAAGYTMMGAQPVIEAEHLSIPDTLNAAVLIKVRYQNQSKGGEGIRDGAGVVKASGDPATGAGMLQMGNEFSLFFGGRVGENIGFLMENNVAAEAGPLIAGLRLPIMFDVAGAKVSAIPFSTDALGVSYGYELSSAGVMRANRWSEQRRDTSAIQYAIADGFNSHADWAGAAAGLALVAQNDMGYINFTKWTPNAMPGGNDGGIASYNTESNYLRIAVTPTVGDWAIVAGAGMMSGSSELAGAGGTLAVFDPYTGALTAGVAPTTDSALVKTEATFADLQAHGQVVGNDMGVYFTWARAPGVDTASGERAQLFNTGKFDKSAMAIGVDYSVIPHVLHVGGSYRMAKTGKAVSATDNSAATDNAVMLQAIYDLTQNVALHVTGSSRNGTKYADPAATGAKEYVFMLEAAW